VDKKLTIVLPLFHVLLSGLSSYATWPLRIFAGLEIESAVIAVIAAAIGTVLGLLRVVNRKLVLLMIVVGMVFVLAVVTYSFILAQAGATSAQLVLAMFMLFLVFLTFFYVLTYLERALVRTLQVKKPSK